MRHHNGEWCALRLTPEGDTARLSTDAGNVRQATIAAQGFVVAGRRGGHLGGDDMAIGDAELPDGGLQLEGEVGEDGEDGAVLLAFGRHGEGGDEVWAILTGLKMLERRMRSTPYRIRSTLIDLESRNEATHPASV